MNVRRFVVAFLLATTSFAASAASPASVDDPEGGEFFHKLLNPFEPAWENVGSPADCNVSPDASDVGYGIEFSQTGQCVQRQQKISDSGEVTTRDEQITITRKLVGEMQRWSSADPVISGPIDADFAELTTPNGCPVEHMKILQNREIEMFSGIYRDVGGRTFVCAYQADSDS
jgi:hypothetical protein